MPQVAEWETQFSLDVQKRPVTCVHVAEQNTSSTPHRHQGLEITYCQSGKGTFEYASRRFPYTAPLIACFHGEAPHAVHVEGLHERWTLWVEPTSLTRSVDFNASPLGYDLISSTGVIVTPVPSDYAERLDFIFQNIAYELQDNRMYQEHIIYYQLQALLTIIRRLAYGRIDIETPCPDEVFDLLAYIEANLGEDLSARRLAEEFHYAEQYFYRAIRRMTGQSLNEYVKSRRIERAKGLLTGTDLTVTAIAEIVGIPDLAQFSRTFRAHAGCPPTEFRRLAKTG